MCIVIDVNALAMVFDGSNAKHNEFSPIKEWITDGKGFLVFGGKKYKRELEKLVQYLKIIRLLKDGGKAISIKDDVVDTIENNVIEKTTGTNCNDQHIIALLAASKCSLLCSTDISSFDFIKDRSLYPKKSPKVKIYKSIKNKNLLKKTKRNKICNAEQP